MNTRKYLELALQEAKIALDTGNYPFGAVIVDANDKVIAVGHNENFSKNDISAHAEIQCLRKIDIHKLLDPANKYFLFCSGEPCGGCSFYISRTNISSVTWALTDPQKVGFDDLRKDKKLDNIFGAITVEEEPFEDLKELSASLLRQYYLKIGKPKKANLY